MEQNNTTQMDENNIMTQADKLFEEVRQTNKGMLKAFKFAENLSKEVDKASEDFKKTEKKLKQFEKETLNKIDEAVLEFVS
ncbi:MAG: hypothetical protein AAB475_00195 [Patescibacteria group bacterium]